MNTSFDNILRMRSRTIHILKKEGREDLAKKIDERLIPSIIKSCCFADTLLVVALLFPGCWGSTFSPGMSHQRLYFWSYLPSWTTLITWPASLGISRARFAHFG